MAKVLQFSFEGKDYTLEYTRRTVEEMERNGFVAADATKKPMSCLPALFKGAFLAHHRYVSDETIDRIYEKMPKKGELINKLAEMYNEPISALTAEPEDGKGNVAWTANW